MAVVLAKHPARRRGVTAVQSVNLTALDNVLRFTAEIQTIYGSTVVNG
ncbi:hypothetical protein FRUB_01249 [Fimbriiglobus ruber]|uniref:Uncharacterized protein n=1 Tax=Fimbriiglobus ruber TaxID=1908690 RepID=A0A225E1F1_9BACT|nr:hypothetical protein FRUB_01249 [Fimbriiglobus ruber]